MTEYGRVEIREAVERKDLRTFIHLPWKLYRGDPNWVPPLLADMWGIVTGVDSPLFASGPHALAVAYRGGEAVGRLAVGVDRKMNQAKGFNHGYIVLFECEKDEGTAHALFRWAEEWLGPHGVDAVKGPISPTNGDDYRGLLVRGFDRPPVLLDAYSPPYYADFWDSYGFEPEIDYFAYLYHADRMSDRYERAATYAMKRYGFRVDPLNLRDLESDLVDIKEIMDRGMPVEWPDLTPPTMEELRTTGRKLRPLAVADLSYVARCREGRPIGFSVGLPDYNQVLAHLNGRLFPFGFLKFLWYRRKIKGCRVFILFVVPEWRKKGVTGAMFLHTIRAARKYGYEWGEGSTIGEFNLASRRDAERAGGIHYKTYRVYRKTLLSGARSTARAG